MYRCISFVSLPPTPPQSYPSRSSQSTELSSLVYWNCPLAIYFTHGSVYTSVLLFQFVPPSRRSTVPSLGLALCSCPAGRLISTIFLDSICMCNIWFCFSLSDLLHSVWCSLGPSTSLQMAQFNRWVIFHCTYVPYLLYPFLYQWTLRLLKIHVLHFIAALFTMAGGIESRPKTKRTEIKD